MDQYELVEGELVRKVSKNRPRVVLLYMLLNWADQTFGKGFVYTKRIWEFSRNPGRHEIRLLVEISDSRLCFDLNTKAQLYARADIKDDWVLDIPGKRVIVHREEL